MADRPQESEGHPVIAGLLALLGVGLAVGLLVSGAALAGTSVLGLGESDGGGQASSDQTINVPKPEPTEEQTGALITLEPKPSSEGGERVRGGTRARGRDLALRGRHRGPARRADRPVRRLPRRRGRHARRPAPRGRRVGRLRRRRRDRDGEQRDVLHLRDHRAHRHQHLAGPGHQDRRGVQRGPSPDRLSAGVALRQECLRALDRVRHPPGGVRRDRRRRGPGAARALERGRVRRCGRCRAVVSTSARPSEDGVVREVREETGYDVELVRHPRHRHPRGAGPEERTAEVRPALPGHPGRVRGAGRGRAAAQRGRRHHRRGPVVPGRRGARTCCACRWSTSRSGWPAGDDVTVVAARSRSGGRAAAGLVRRGCPRGRTTARRRRPSPPTPTPTRSEDSTPPPSPTRAETGR